MASGLKIGRMTRIVARFLAIILGIVLLLLLTAYIILQTAWGNRQLKNFTTSWLSKKLKTEVRIGKIELKGFNGLHIYNVNIRDRANQPLFLADTLELSFDISGITSKKIGIGTVRIAGLDASINRPAKGEPFNYEFIADAFVSPSDTPADTAASPWVISLGDVNLSRIRFHYDDAATNSFYHIGFSRFRTNLSTSDPTGLQFTTSDTYLDSLRAAIRLAPSEDSNATANEAVNTFLAFTGNNIRIKDANLVLENPADSLHLHTNIPLLTLQGLNYDQKANSVRIHSILLSEHNTSLIYRPTEQKAADTASSIAMLFRADTISIVNNNISVRNSLAKKTYTDRFDADHLDLKALQLQASALQYDGNTFRGNIHHLSFKDQNGFAVKNISGDAYYSDTLLYVNGLSLETNKNKVDGNLRMSYPSLATIMENPAATKLQLAVNSATLSTEEIAYFSPSLRQNDYVQKFSGRKIGLSLKANGTLDNLSLPAYSIATGGTRIAGSANILHPTDAKRVSANASFSTISSTRSELQGMLPSNLIADSIWDYVPERFNIRGNLAVSQQRIAPDLTISSSSGDLSLKGYINDPANSRSATYDLATNTHQLQLGRILGDTTMGKLSMQAHVRGRGFYLSTMKADGNAQVSSFQYKGYNYHDVDIKGGIADNIVNAEVQLADPNADLSAITSFKLGTRPSAIIADMQVRNLDLDALGFADSGLAIKGNLKADLPKVDSNILQGDVNISGLDIRYNNKNYFIDSITAHAEKKLDSQFISLNSSFIHATLNGKYSLEALPANIKVLSDNYLLTTGSIEPFTAPMYADLKADIHIPDSIAGMIPGLRSVSPFKFRAMMNTDLNEIMVGTKINKLVYEDYTAEGLIIGFVRDSTVSNDTTLQFAFKMDRLAGASIDIGYSVFGGSVQKGVMNGALAFFSKDGKRVSYGIPFTLVNDPERPYLSLNDTLVLNKTRWRANENNRVYLNPKDLRGTDLRLFSGNQSISIISDPANFGYPLVLDVKQFNLESIAGILNKDSLFASGTVNGSFNLASTAPLRFNTDMRVDSLAVLGSPIGNLKALAQTDSTGLMNADVSLTGAGNNASVKGSYQTETKTVNMDLNLAPLSLRSLRPLASGYVDSLKGSINGALTIGGKTDDPQINGQLRLDSSYFIIRQTGAPISTSSASLDFRGRQILFNGMQFADSAGNPAVIAGTVNVEDLSKLEYDLKLKTSRFLVAGHRRIAEQQLTGPLYVAADLSIKGSQNEAVVNGSVNVKDSSVMTYVVSRDETVDNRKGLIEFFDPSKPAVRDTLEIEAKDVASPFKLALNTYLNVTPSSTVVIVLDELTGDKLRVKGTANFNFGIDPAGTTSLVGNYAIDSGSYDLSIAGLIRKEFTVQQGSNINWSGDVMEGNMDLHALYRVRTDASELVSDIQSVPGIAKQKFNFLVFMDLKGPLLKPKISFSLDMAENEKAAFEGIVYNRIKQVNNTESELNKQVMGLLALNSFIAENPFNSVGGSGGSFETQAFSTAGNLLTQELNDFIGNNVKDVDIDIGLDIRDDYTSGQAVRKSDLKVGLTKSFSNNRLNIYVGNTFALENQNQQQDLLSGLAGDVSLEYLLTSDGRYRLRGYRHTQNDITFNGTVVETGASFVVVIEFNKLKNALRSKKKRNKNQDASLEP